LQKNSNRLNLTTYCLTEVAERQFAVLEQHGALIHRLLFSTHQLAFLPQFDTEWKRLREAVNRSTLELMLLQPISQQRDSAVKQLAEVYGDAHSLSMLHEVRRQLGNDGESDLRQFDVGLERLEERLTGQQRSADLRRALRRLRTRDGGL
jgi:hypothetical protein